MNRMKQLQIIIITLLVLINFYGCPFGYPNREFPTGVFPDSVCNLTIANSEYDDINMDLMEVNCTNYLVFSSNRLTNGKTYDLVTQVVSFSWDQIDGDFSVKDNVYDMDVFINGMATASRTSGNEYGPLVFMKPDVDLQKYFFIYSDDELGTQDVRFFELNQKYNISITATFSDSIKEKKNTIAFLSDPGFNEGYVSFLTDQYPPYDPAYYSDTAHFQKLVYCNDSLGHYDIFSIDIPQDMEPDSFLRLQTGIIKTNLETINSTSNDRCPNVNRNFMVFSSDRPGGFGGFDFYYSIYENGQWNKPINFGTPINSAYDEFRAIAIKAVDYENDLLIFSSNRPGGKGGFDIYYTGISVMPE